jgi:hypothetical protein
MYTPLLPQGFVRRKDQRILADEDALRSVRLTFAPRRLASPQMTLRYGSPTDVRCGEKGGSRVQRYFMSAAER